MKLTPDQISTLKNFIRSKGYTEPDIQLELLDHLACGIEERIASVGFDKALKDTYSNFGILGFSTFVEGMNKALEKTSWNQTKTLLKKTLTFPWIFLTLISGYGLYWVTLKYTFSVPMVILGCSFITYIFFYFKFIYTQERKFKNLALIKNSNAFVGGTVGASMASFSLFNALDSSSYPLFSILFSLLWTAIILFLLLTSFVMKRVAIERAQALQQVYGNLDTI
jgi:uncharacterized membrane protein YjfL (UPF0719 family)